MRHLVFGLGVGGTERAAQNLAIATARRGHQTELIALQGGPREDPLRDAGVDVRVIHERSNTAIAQLDPVDVLIIHSHGLEASMVDAITRGSGDPRVGEINVFSEPSPWMDRVDVSFQLSPWAHWLYVDRGGDRERSSMLPYPVVDQGFFKDVTAGEAFRSTHGIAPDSFVIGRVGQPYPGKWSPWLVKAVRALHRQRYPIHLLLVGAPPEIVDDARARLKSEVLTVVPKLVGDDVLRAAYCAMDVFAHSARQGESFGYVLAEAALCEVPIVTMATPWVDNSQGWVAGPSARVAVTPQGFTQAIGELIGSDRQLERLNRGRVARQHVLDAYSVSSVGDEVWQVLSASRPKVALPTRKILSETMYQGFDTPMSMRMLTRKPGARISAALSGQESWRWFITQELNSRGISRESLWN